MMKIGKILKAIDGCDAVITLRTGIERINKLGNKVIKVIQMYDSINDRIMTVVKVCNSNYGEF